MLRPRLVKSEPPLSPEREALAAAIQAHAEAERDLAGLRAAAEFGGAAHDAAQAAERALEAARERLAQANAARATALVSASLAGASAPADGTIRAAREAVMAAEDELEAARSARATLKARIPAAEERVAGAQFALQRRAEEVMRAEVGPIAAALVEDFQNVRAQFGRQAQIIEWLVGRKFVAAHGGTDHPNLQGDHPWAQALADLQRDAATPLPIVE